MGIEEERHEKKKTDEKGVEEERHVIKKTDEKRIEEERHVKKKTEQKRTEKKKIQEKKAEDGTVKARVEIDRNIAVNTPNNLYQFKIQRNKSTTATRHEEEQQNKESPDHKPINQFNQILNDGTQFKI